MHFNSDHWDCVYTHKSVMKIESPSDRRMRFVKYHFRRSCLVTQSLLERPKMSLLFYYRNISLRNNKVRTFFLTILFKLINCQFEEGNKSTNIEDLKKSRKNLSCFIIILQHFYNGEYTHICIYRELFFTYIFMNTDFNK